MRRLLRIPRPAGFTLLELIVVLAILGVLVALLLPAVQKARASAIRTKCENQLHQLGVACFGYEAAKGTYPNQDFNSGKTIITSILDYIEQGTNSVIAQNNTGDGKIKPPVVYVPGDYKAPSPIPILSCPGRRGTEVGPRCDYAGGAPPNPDNFTTSAGLASKGLWTVLLKKDAKGNKNPPVTPAIVTAADGTSNTVLLAHKAIVLELRNVQPILCCGGGSSRLPSNADGYFTDNYYLNMFRGGKSAVQYTFRADGPDLNPPNNVQQWFSTPHGKIMPCLFADGSVRSVSITASDDLCVRLFAYNDGRAISGEELP